MGLCLGVAQHGISKISFHIVYRIENLVFKIKFDIKFRYKKLLTDIVPKFRYTKFLNDISIYRPIQKILYTYFLQNYGILKISRYTDIFGILKY